MDGVLKQKIEDMSDKPGVYFFKNANEAVIYVGKAKNLKKRVKNHFQKPDQHAFDFISQIADIDFILTDSENAALILEQQFIKKLQPRWNVEWKDDKNYFFIAQTAETFPRVYLTHQPQKLTAAERPLLFNRGLSAGPLTSDYYGPFVSGREVKSFLREIRKALPYRTCRNLPKKPCFYQSLGLCSAPCVYKKRKVSYGKMIAALTGLIKLYLGEDLRIECYDISNLSGTLAVGSMVVFQRGLPDKNQYRKFKIKTVTGQNDVASLKEVLSRRMKHGEWQKPDLIILDGGKGQLKAAAGINLPVVALAKIKKNDGKLFTPFSKNYAQLSRLPKNISDLFLQIRDEAHRFAIVYNKKRREEKLK
jgi:excinuclease UvrABC nuclease subunit